MRAQIDEAEFKLRGLVKANPKFFGYTRFGLEFCEWCYCVIYNRGLMVRGPDGIAIPVLPPLFDLVNHSEDPNCILESAVLEADDGRGVILSESGLYIVNPNGSVVKPDGGVIMSCPGQPLIVPPKGELVIGQDKKVYVQTESGFIKREDGNLILGPEGEPLCLGKGEKLLVSEAGEILRHLENGTV